MKKQIKVAKQVIDMTELTTTRLPYTDLTIRGARKSKLILTLYWIHPKIAK